MTVDLNYIAIGIDDPSANHVHSSEDILSWLTSDSTAVRNAFISRNGAFLDVSDIAFLFQDLKATVGAVVNSPVGLIIDKSKGANASNVSEMYKGLTGNYDYYIDANGNDSNNGLTPETAWQSMNKINTSSNTVKGGTVRYLIKSGTYDKVSDYILITTTSNNIGIDIVFEPDCIMDGTLVSAQPTKYDGIDVSNASNSYHVNIYSNGATLQNYVDETDSTTTNGVGARNNVVINVYDLTVDYCNDGVSCHNSSTINLYDCVIRNCRNACVNNVDTTFFTANRCSFVGRSGPTNLVMQYEATAVAIYNDCIFTPANNNQFIRVANSTFNRCRIGADSVSPTFIKVKANSTVLNDCYINLYSDGDVGIIMNKCFGRFSTRPRSTATNFIYNSVITGPCSGKTNVITGYDNNNGNKIVCNNNIFSMASGFMSVNSSQATAMVTAASEFKNNILYGGIAYDTDLIDADTQYTVIVGTVTSNPLIGAANTYSMGDYGFLAGSPAIGAGTNGNIGFSVSDAVNLEPKQTRGPSGIAGNHAVQSTSDNRPTLKSSGSGDNTIYWLDFSSGKSIDITFASSLGTDCTVLYGTPSLEPNVSIGNTITTSYSVGTNNTMALIFDSALSLNETRDIKSYIRSKSRA